MAENAGKNRREVPKRYLFERMANPDLDSDSVDWKGLIADQIQRSVVTSVSRYDESYGGVMNYGVESITNVGAGDGQAIERFRMQVEEAVKRWEPRLSGYTVSLLATNDPLTPIQISITGTIRWDTMGNPLALTVPMAGN